MNVTIVPKKKAVWGERNIWNTQKPQMTFHFEGSHCRPSLSAYLPRNKSKKNDKKKKFVGKLGKSECDPRASNIGLCAEGMLEKYWDGLLRRFVRHPARPGRHLLGWQSLTWQRRPRQCQHVETVHQSEDFMSKHKRHTELCQQLSCTHTHKNETRGREIRRKKNKKPPPLWPVQSTGGWCGWQQKILQQKENLHKWIGFLEK